MSSWDSFSDDQETYSRNRSATDRLKQVLEIMFVMAGKKASEEKIAMTIASLRPLLHEPELYAHLEHVADKCEAPSPAKIKESVYAAIRQKTPHQAPPELTDEQRDRSRQAALKTALWLHYEHGWSFSSFGTHMMGAALRKQESLSDAELFAMLEGAKRKHPRAEIARWMENQP